VDEFAQKSVSMLEFSGYYWLASRRAADDDDVAPAEDPFCEGFFEALKQEE
jgi:hypothetical protein